MIYTQRFTSTSNNDAKFSTDIPTKSLQLFRLRLTKDGYLMGDGSYYGVGLPVYRAVYDAGHTIYVAEVRARSRVAAMKALQIQAHQLIKQ